MWPARPDLDPLRVHGHEEPAQATHGPGRGARDDDRLTSMTQVRAVFLAAVQRVPGVVPISGDRECAEIALGSALALTDEEYQEIVGKIAAAFFVAVFPGNVSQYVNRRSAFGLDTDERRFARLFFQPLLVLWALGLGGVGGAA